MLGCEEDKVDDEEMIVSAERRLPIFNERSLEVEDKYEVELKQQAIKSLLDAENMAEQLRDFAQFNGHQELSLVVLSNMKDILNDL